MTDFISQAKLAKNEDRRAIPQDLRLQEMVKPAPGSKHIYEFIGTDSFANAWYDRQQYEVNAGRLEVPTLYEPIYSIVRDANLPRNVTINAIGPGGVILEQIKEGGEVKFATVGESTKTAEILHYGVGLEYSDDLVAFNELWTVVVVERAVGKAYNALLNHLHFNPILTYSYASTNQTAANTSGSTYVEDTMLTIEDAISAARLDTNNPRPGPYVLLINGAKEGVVGKALTREVQQGLASQSRSLDSIQAVISYNGWSGTRGSKTVSYSGVTSSKAYLIDVSQKDMDFQSFMKKDLAEYGRQEDVSRFLLQIVWDTRFGVYANPLAAVEEITLPSA